MEQARRTLPLMAKYHVPPTPENYAVWYHFIGEQQPELTEELQGYIDEKRVFTPDLNNYLYHRYVARDLDQRVVEQTTEDAQKLLDQVLLVLQKVISSNDEYGAGVDEYIEGLEESIQSPELRNALKTVVEKTKEIRKKGSQLSERLDATSREVHSLKRDIEQLSRESQKDFLTGVDNRKAFDLNLKENLERFVGEGELFALLMVDIDHFKEFNDKYGHQVGDEVLKQVARMLMDSVKGRDQVARYGGEEFAIMLPDTPLAGGLSVAEALRKTIGNKIYRIKNSNESIPSITISLGVAVVRKGDTAESIVKRADDALYRSKQGGRNKVTQESA